MYSLYQISALSVYIYCRLFGAKKNCQKHDFYKLGGMRGWIHGALYQTYFTLKCIYCRPCGDKNPWFWQKFVLWEGFYANPNLACISESFVYCCMPYLTLIGDRCILLHITIHKHTNFTIIGSSCTHPFHWSWPYLACERRPTIYTSMANFICIGPLEAKSKLGRISNSAFFFWRPSGTETWLNASAQLHTFLSPMILKLVYIPTPWWWRH